MGWLLLWTAIVLVNFGWTAFLFRQRKREHNHPVLWLFFGAYAFSDTIGYIGAPIAKGGLGLLPTHEFFDLWVVIRTALWLAWSAAPVLAVVHLIKGKVPRWVWWAVLVPLTLVSVSEVLGAPTLMRRILVHWAMEPVCLGTAIVLSVWYMLRNALVGEDIDYLAFAVLWTSSLLGMKLIVLLDSNFKMNRAAAFAYFFVYIAICIAMYFVWIKINKWIQSRCR